ncbi:MAG: hypothetical protein WC728_17675 [Elusimicrobiota bacterium]
MGLLLLMLAMASPGWAQSRNSGFPLFDGEAVQAARRYLPVPTVQLRYPEDTGAKGEYP